MEDDGDEKDDTKRKSRNLSEKKRRDQFNLLVTEMSNLISNNTRKMDKSTVLKSSITFLRNHNEVIVQSRAHDVHHDWKPVFFSNEEFSYLSLESLEGFIMVFSTRGRVHYASENIAPLLGHNPAEIVDMNFYNMMHEDEQQQLYNMIQRNASLHNENQSSENEMIRFQVNMRRGCLDFREEISYEAVQFYGHFRTNQKQDKDREVMDFRDDESSSRVLFVCVGCLRTPKLIRDVSLVDSTRNEFSSRHSLEWKFLFLDHRAPPIIGYAPFEVLGTSAFDYYHFDDLEKIISCHKILMQKGELTSCYYRFLTKGQQWIWLQTRFYITYHQWNSKPEFVMCTHRVVSYTDVIKTKEEFIEQDLELTESDAVSIKEVPVKILPSLSPPYDISDATDDSYGSGYPSSSQPTQAGSASASSNGSTITQSAVLTADSWNAQRHYTGSDTSVSGDSRSSQRNSDLEHAHIQPPPPGEPLQPLQPLQHLQPLQPLQPLQATKEDCLEHSMDGEYLVAPPYVTGEVSSDLLSLRATPARDQAQIQEQLQRKHEELQQMIAKQQEELRRVREQLVMARLGILPPLVNVPENSAPSMHELQSQQPSYSAQGPLPQLTMPTMSAQQPQQSHPDHQPMNQ